MGTEKRCVQLISFLFTVSIAGKWTAFCFPRRHSVSTNCEVFAVLIFISDRTKWTHISWSPPNTQSEEDRSFRPKTETEKHLYLLNLLCPFLIVANWTQFTRTLCSGLVLFWNSDYWVRIEGFVTHVLLCETLYRVYYYHFFNLLFCDNPFNVLFGENKHWCSTEAKVAFVTQTQK